jgi:hypothetical protein
VPERVRAIYDVLAFVGRYGHQPVDVLLEMTFNELSLLADALQRLMDKEGDPLRERMAGG